MRETMEIVVDGKTWAFPCRPRSEAPLEQDRVEEDEAFAGPDTLEDLRSLPGGVYWELFLPGGVYYELFEALGVGVWQEWVMYIHKRIAEHYGVNPDKVLENWIKRYGWYGFDSSYFFLKEKR